MKYDFKLYMWLIRGSRYSKWKSKKGNKCYKIKRGFSIRWYDYFKANRRKYKSLLSVTRPKNKTPNLTKA